MLDMAQLMACRGDNVTVLSNDLAATVPPRRVITAGVSPGAFSRFPFLGPWNAFKRDVPNFRYGGSAEADFGEFNTQKLILGELPEKCPRRPGSENCSPGAHQDANVFSATGH
jgi:hypothetical protein